jgi:dihydroneopterin aldolase
VSDEVFVKGLIALGICGCLEHERTTAQPFQVDLVVTMDLDHAAKSDDLHDTVNYALLADAATKLVETGEFYLVEALAGAIGEACLAIDARLEKAKVTVTKLNPPITQRTSGVGCTKTVKRK